MNGIEFARPWILLALPIVPLVFALWIWGSARARARARSVSRLESGRPPYLGAALFAVAALLAIVAAALPQWGTRQSHIPRQGADLIVILDISRSMDAQDVAPSRLGAAKAALSQTLNRLGGDRVGLVVFAGSARIRFPLTTDLSAANQVIASLETGTVIVEGGTNASLGLDQARESLNDQGAGGRAILLITDGDDLGLDPSAAAQRLKDSGIDFLVAGVGTPAGGPIPVFDPGTQKTISKLDANGQPIVTRLNETFLKAVAAAGGGRYIGADPSAIAGAVSGRIQALKSTRIDDRPTTLPIERFQWFAAAALAALVLASLSEWLGYIGRRALLAAATALAGLLLAGCATSAYTANEEGRDLLKRGDASAAIDKFAEAQAAKPDDPAIALNLAAAYHAAGRYDEATLAARRVTGSPAAIDRARAFASIGHHEFAAGHLPDSLEAFRRSLLEDPTNDVTRHDYEVVLKLINPNKEPEPGDQQPGATATPSPGPGSGGQGNGGTPVAATPSPGTGTPAAGGTPAPGPSGPQSAQDIDRQLRNIDSRVARLVQEAGDTPTATQAVEILRLLEERSRIAALRDAGGSTDPRDY